MRALLLLLVACKAGSGDTDVPDTDSDTDPPFDTDVPDLPPGTTPLAGLDADGVGAVCDALESVAEVSLACGAYTLAYGGALPDCDAALGGVPGGCPLTVDDLLACADQIPTATCATDFSEDPCRALYEPGCSSVAALATDLLGGPFGLQDGMPISGLTASQRFAFCLESTGFAPFTVTCNGEITVEPATQAECTAQIATIPGACGATLGDSRACIDAVLAGDCDALFGGGPCAPLLDAACQP